MVQKGTKETILPKPRGIKPQIVYEVYHFENDGLKPSWYRTTASQDLEETKRYAAWRMKDPRCLKTVICKTTTTITREIMEDTLIEKQGKTNE